MQVQLTEKDRQRVLDNQKLVHYIVQKMNYNDSYDDLVSIGTIGLCKAVVTFDESRGLQFSTYATRCIKNEILMCFRKEHQDVYINSLDEPIIGFGAKGEDSEDYTYGSILSDGNDFVEELLDKDEFIDRINIILNFLDSFERDLILLKLAGFTQMEMAEFFNISQSQISRREKSVENKLLKCQNTNINYSKKYRFNCNNNKYTLGFFVRIENDFNKIFAMLLEQIDNNQKFMTNFELQCYNEVIIFSLKKCQKSFAFITQILRAMDLAFSE